MEVFKEISWHELPGRSHSDGTPLTRNKFFFHSECNIHPMVPDKAALYYR